MPEIDLEPKDYRADPLKGERVFLPGGVRLLLTLAVVVTVVVLLNIYVRPYFTEFVMSFRHD